MPNPGSTVDASPAALGNEEPPPKDGWRPIGLNQAADPVVTHRNNAHPEPTLATLRAELDRIDNAVQDLLIERATVVEQVALAAKPAAFRPGREASIVRRLVGRHHGALPAASVFRIWRELLAGTTAMQGGLLLAVSDTDPGAALTQLAREHFGALTPLRIYGSAGQALADVSNGSASIAVLPFPSDINTWWIALLHHEPRLHIIARLPFWRKRPDGAPLLEALAVAAAPPDVSGDDRSFLGLECDSDVSRTRLSGELAAAGLAPDMMLLLREQGSTTAHVLAEVNGFLADDDPRLSRLGVVLRRPVVIGNYAAPFAEAIT
jgi:chorismate mutase/prephenate dehydratase